jgi:hypothetical protein
MSVGFGTSSELKEKYESEEEVKRKLEQIRDNLEPEVALKLQAVMEKIKDLAIEMCPKESGALASSIELGSEGGSGTVQAGDFYENSIFAGNDETFNFQHQPTSQYALIVHDGTSTKEGVPFLTNALDFYSEELNACVNRALAHLCAGMEND